MRIPGKKQMREGTKERKAQDLKKIARAVRRELKIQAPRSLARSKYCEVRTSTVVWHKLILWSANQLCGVQIRTVKYKVGMSGTS